MNDPAALLGQGARAAVVRQEGWAVKQYRPGHPAAEVFAEAAAAAWAARQGVPTPRIEKVCRSGERWQLWMECVAGESLAGRVRRQPEQAGQWMGRAAALQERLHRAPGGPLLAQKEKLWGKIQRAGLPEGRQAALGQLLAGLPRGERLCHGDFHPENLLVDGQEALWVIDWADGCSGLPAADACRSALLLALYRPLWGRQYLDAYCAAAGVHSREVTAWMPVMAAGRLCEGQPGERERLMGWLEPGAALPWE